MEGVKEVECVVPSSWMDEAQQLVYWPRVNEAVTMRRRREPEPEWLSFPLVKVKIRAGNTY